MKHNIHPPESKMMISGLAYAERGLILLCSEGFLDEFCSCRLAGLETSIPLSRERTISNELCFFPLQISTMHYSCFIFQA